MATGYGDDVPDMQKGGMTSSEKGKGMLHNLHFGELVLNHPTTKKLLKALGVGIEMARKMKPEDLMKKVKEMIDKLPAREEGGMAATPRTAPAKNAPSRMKGGVSATQPPRVDLAAAAPARKKGGVSAAPGRAAPAKDAPSRKKGGMSDLREKRDRDLGRMPRADEI